MSRMRRALYPGSFDPPTLGHLWMVQQGLTLFDEVVVGVGENPEKRCMLSAARRAQLFHLCLEEDMGEVPAGLRVITYENRLTVDVARDQQAGFLLRGLRGPVDLHHELVQRHVNADMAPDLTSVFLTPPRDVSHISSTLVRGLVGLEGWERAVREMVPAPVLEALRELA
jgi:pantetheine-phosphate adenylyltransferase